jgi:hypothetical protein
VSESEHKPEIALHRYEYILPVKWPYRLGRRDPRRELAQATRKVNGTLDMTGKHPLQRLTTAGVAAGNAGFPAAPGRGSGLRLDLTCA